LRYAVGNEVGDGGGAQAPLLAQQLRGDDEIAEVFQESLVVCPAESGVYCLLRSATSAPVYKPDAPGEDVPSRRCGCAQRSHSARGLSAVVAASGRVFWPAASKGRGARSRGRWAAATMSKKARSCPDLRLWRICQLMSLLTQHAGHLPSKNAAKGESSKITVSIGLSWCGLLRPDAGCKRDCARRKRGTSTWAPVARKDESYRCPL
jgi:hypothetical protein